MTSDCDCEDRMHGWSVGDLNRAATVITRIQTWMVADRDELHAAAYDGAVDAILGSNEHPRWGDLLDGARRGISVARRIHRHNHGLDATASRVMPAFVTYWADWIAPASRYPAEGFDERVVERLAVQQVLAALPDDQRRPLELLRDTGRPAGVREALRLTETTANRRILAARIAATALWHEGETPPPVPRNSTRREVRCGTRAGYVTHRARKEPACQDCREANNAETRARRAS